MIWMWNDSETTRNTVTVEAKKEQVIVGTAVMKTVPHPHEVTEVFMEEAEQWYGCGNDSWGG